MPYLKVFKLLLILLLYRNILSTFASMKRISILFSVIIAATLLACNSRPTLETKAKERLDSLIIVAKSKPIERGNIIVRTMKFVETTFSDEELCVLRYSVELGGKSHGMEYIVMNPPQEYNPDAKLFFYAHIIDSCINRDKLKGVPVASIIDLSSKEGKESLFKMRGKSVFEFN